MSKRQSLSSSLPLGLNRADVPSLNTKRSCSTCTSSGSAVSATGPSHCAVTSWHFVAASTPGCRERILWGATAELAGTHDANTNITNHERVVIEAPQRCADGQVPGGTSNSPEPQPK